MALWLAITCRKLAQGRVAIFPLLGYNVLWADAKCSDNTLIASSFLNRNRSLDAEPLGELAAIGPELYWLASLFNPLYN